MLISWTGFYRNLLGSSQQKSIQQKEISGFLTKLWQADPFKAKWTILAKSYSVIRDAQGKKNAPLDEFLTMTGPLIGIVPPNLYFSVTGWQMSFSGDGQMVLARDHSVNLAYLDHNLLTTNMSVEDIINFCYHNGYVNSDGIVKLAAYGQSTLAMACTTNEPSTESLSDLSIDDLLAVVGGDEGNFAASDEKASSNTNNSVGQGGSFDEQDTYTPLNPVFTTNPAFDPQIALGNQSFEFDQALDSFYQDGSMVPNFDPYMGNSFNAYNISDFQTTEENEFNFLEFF